MTGAATASHAGQTQVPAPVHHRSPPRRRNPRGSRRGDIAMSGLGIRRKACSVRCCSLRWVCRVWGRRVGCSSVIRLELAEYPVGWSFVASARKRWRRAADAPAAAVCETRVASVMCTWRSWGPGTGRRCGRTRPGRMSSWSSTPPSPHRSRGWCSWSMTRKGQLDDGGLVADDGRVEIGDAHHAGAGRG